GRFSIVTSSISMSYHNLFLNTYHFFYSYYVYRHPHSFPTRRSSDLGDEHGEVERHHRHRGVQRGAALDHLDVDRQREVHRRLHADRQSTRLNSSHVSSSYAVFCLKKKNL